MKNDSEFSPQSVKISGRDINYVKAGSGPPLILLHGLGRSVWQWKDHIPFFAETHTVYAFDVPGFGHSATLKRHELAIMAAPTFIEQFRQHFAIEKPIILGGSFGGLAAMDYALEWPNNISKLVLMGTAGIGREVGIGYRTLTLPIIGELWSFIDHHGIDDPDNWIWKTTRLPKIGKIIEYIFKSPDEETRKSTRKENKATPLKFFRYGIDIFGQKRSIRRDDKLHRIKVPTLILWGANDKMFPPKHADKAYRLIPNSWLCVVEGAEHWIPRAKPEEFNQAVKKFILN